MAGPASNFILNIVELQNTITSASGLTPLAALSNTVSQIQEMVNYDEKRIAVNAISRYNTTPIQVQDSLNMAAGTSILQEGVIIAGTGSTGSSTMVDFTTVAAIGNGPSQIEFGSTMTAGAPAISFQVGGGGGGGGPSPTPMVVTADGALRLPVAGTPALGKYLMCMDGGGTAQWQPLAMPSDARLKKNIRTLENAGEIVSSLRGVRFNWRSDGEEDIGFIAQEVQEVLPEAILGGNCWEGSDLCVQYVKIIPILVEEIKQLRNRVEVLERICGGAASAL